MCCNRNVNQMKVTKSNWFPLPISYTFLSHRTEQSILSQCWFKNKNTNDANNGNANQTEMTKKLVSISIFTCTPLSSLNM